MSRRIVANASGWVLAVCLLASSGSAQPRAASSDAVAFRVTHYDVLLEPRLDSRTVTGTATLTVIPQGAPGAGADVVTLDRGRLEIDSVREGGRRLAFVPDGNRVRITVVTLDDPRSRGTLRLRVVMPRDWTGAASGRHVSRRLSSPGQPPTIARWFTRRAATFFTTCVSCSATRFSGMVFDATRRGISARR